MSVREEQAMLKRFLVAVDRLDPGGVLIEYATQLAQLASGNVGVLHCIEFIGRGCAAPLESRAEANLLVEDAVFRLRMAGVGSEGAIRSALRKNVATLIVEASEQWNADAIIVGSQHRRGLGRLIGHGVREKVAKKSQMPVLVAPASSHPGQVGFLLPASAD